MSAAPPAQRLAVSSGGALDDVAVVDLVLRFAGSRQALFLKINKTWSACYEIINRNDTASSSYDHVHSANCTSLEAVFGSAARLNLSLERGLQPELDSFGVHRAAGKAADASTLTAAHELGMPWAPKLMQSMARHNRLCQLQWLHTEQGCQLPEDICAHAAESGSIDMLKWLKEQGSVFDKSTMRSAADHGHVVRYLRAEGCPWHFEACLAALRRSDRDLILWALEHGFEYHDKELEFSYFCDHSWETVIKTGSLEMVIWLVELQLDEVNEPDLIELSTAIASGHVDICRYLKDVRGCDWHDSPWRDNIDPEWCAARSDKAEMCEWLLEANFPLDVDTLAEKAACNGAFTVLRWALERGAQLTATLLKSAAEGGSVDILAYVFNKLKRDEIVIEPTLLTRMLNAAGGNYKLEAAKWLRQRGAEWPAVLQFVKQFSDGDEHIHTWGYNILEWARAEGCTSPTTKPPTTGTA
eukprot:5679-Heterococcus_DN1.PRE.1